MLKTAIKYVILIPTLTITILLLLIFAITLRPIGGTPSGDIVSTIKKSKQYSIPTSQFQNSNPTPLRTGRSSSEFMYDFFSTGKQRTPLEKLPEDPPSLPELEVKSDSLRFIWFGHSTILLEINSTRILIDPVFSNNASPLPFMINRFQPPVFTIDQITDVDLILISHDHYDHLDYETISKLKNRDLQFIVPLGVGAHLEFWGLGGIRGGGGGGGGGGVIESIR